jgi:BlaI family transcriptional regulator, penicillinase repressor
MGAETHPQLSRRERQIMDILYRLRRATAAEVLEKMPDKLSYSSIRAQLRILEEKGHLRHEEESLRYVYMPTVTRDRAGKSALRHMMDTFFEGSPEKMVATLLDRGTARISDAELDRLSDLIEKAKKEGR